MPLYDWKCHHCGTIDRDILYTISSLPPSRPCPCGASQEQLYEAGRNHIHQTHSGMYGKMNPALGCVVESYDHKNRLLKEYGMMEAADPVGGSRDYKVPEGYQGDGVVKVEKPRKLGTWLDESEVKTQAFQEGL